MILAILVAAAQFGGHGQVVPFGSLSFSHASSAGVTSNEVFLQPGAFVFAIDHLAVGLSLHFVYVHEEGVVNVGGANLPTSVSETLFGVSPMVGAAFNLTDALSLFPQLGVDLLHESSTNAFMPAQTVGELDAFVPLLFSPVEHFFVGLGPYLDWTFHGPDGTTIGLRTTIGGWF